MLSNAMIIARPIYSPFRILRTKRKDILLGLVPDVKFGLVRNSSRGPLTSIRTRYAPKKAEAPRGGPGGDDERIAERLEVGRATTARVRKEFVEESLGAALSIN
jgi:hypothetical protein